MDGETARPIGHYLRVQEAAALLGVTPATIRWYVYQGWLPAYRVGRGRLTHRRFCYPDLVQVAARTGRFIPAEPAWPHDLPITVGMAARYLGLSDRYLLQAGWLRPGAVLRWEDLQELERRIYRPEVDTSTPPPIAGPPVADPTGKESETMGMGHAMGRMGAFDEEGMVGGRHCHGRMGPGHGGPRWGRRGGWPETDLPGEGASLLALRRAKRHLEARKADLEDQLAELERRIQAHPDYNPPSAE